MWILMLWLLVVIFLLAPVLIYLIFWYETANSVYRATLYGRSNGKPQLWLLRGILSGICTNVVVICLFPFGFVKRMWFPDPGSAKGGPAVVLVHGIYHNPAAWVITDGGSNEKITDESTRFATEVGRPVFGGLQRTGSVDETCGKRCRRQDIVLVGHSLGGLLPKPTRESAVKQARPPFGA